MSSGTHAASAADPVGAEYVDGYLPDDDVLAAARARAADLGCSPLASGAGATLRFLAATVAARAVVEVGTGTGVSGLHLLRGMAADGILTSIDLEPEYQRAARKAFLEAGYPPGRTRLIVGRALDVLPRLTPGGYDLVFIDAARIEFPSYYEKGVALLRRGGIIAFHNVLAGGRVADPSRRDPETLALREVARAMREDERLVPALLPVGGGLLVAAAC
ncbi:MULTISPECIES: O-methyltransferase [Amycolatopsis]|uniref:Predicted O-methyltransferase YrrM n=1 Tax=Amycolatopsis saalfeldensis TaxID=394193 RepID=A0A1H8YKH1_9PSEU|nr:MULTISPECIES: O-methyltransferase [Amycolatopsis]SEP52650.1 Predicted O-methyltransferase YrrM [Amycolatopsis saalfeldensis]